MLLLQVPTYLLGGHGGPASLELRHFGRHDEDAAPLPPRVLRQAEFWVDTRFTSEIGVPMLCYVVEKNAGYELVKTGGVTAVRPKGALTDPSDWLNARVSRLQMRDATVVETLISLMRTFDMRYDGSLVRSSTDTPPLVLSVSLSAATVRDVLDAVAQAFHGAWVVSYGGTTASCENARIDFAAWNRFAGKWHPRDGVRRRFGSCLDRKRSRRDATKPVHVKLDAPTLRAVLNALVNAHGAAYWVVEPDPASPATAAGPKIILIGRGWAVATTLTD